MSVAYPSPESEQAETPPIEIVRAAFNAVSLASNRELRFGRRHGESWGGQMLRQSVAYREGFTKVETLVRQAVLRERAANAEIAARYSEAAAGEILARPMPEAWR